MPLNKQSSGWGFDTSWRSCGVTVLTMLQNAISANQGVWIFILLSVMACCWANMGRWGDKRCGRATTIWGTGEERVVCSAPYMWHWRNEHWNQRHIFGALGKYALKITTHICGTGPWWDKICWLCPVPTSTTRFASDVGHRMAKQINRVI